MNEPDPHTITFTLGDDEITTIIEAKEITFHVEIVKPTTRSFGDMFISRSILQYCPDCDDQVNILECGHFQITSDV